MNRPAIRKARTSDLNSILSLLQSESLPSKGVPEHLGNFLVATQGETIIGTIGLELYGETALLRSAVVAASHRDKGVGRLLYDRILRDAKESGVKRLVLLTTSAEGYFRRRGFVRTERATLAGPVTTSSEFTETCPASAICMELAL